jgi:hypothetical protein
VRLNHNYLFIYLFIYLLEFEIGKYYKIDLFGGML